MHLKQIKTLQTARFALAALVVGLALGPGALNAQTFTKIADTNTVIPNGTGAYTMFNLPLISGGTVAFGGTGAAQLGLYIWNGSSLSRWMDLNTAIPNGTGKFTAPNFNDSSISNNAVLFPADGASSQSGIYRGVNGVVSRVIDANFNQPGTSTKFQTFAGPSESGGIIAFAGTANQWTDQSGVYTISGSTVTPIITTGTALPGGSDQFSSSFKIINNNGQLAFKVNTTGVTNHPGIYSWSGTALGKVITAGTGMPVIGKAITDFLDQMDMDMDSGTVIFSAISTVSGGYDQGIYSATLTGGSLTRLVDTAMTIPGTTTKFANLEGFKMISGTLVFSGSDLSYYNGVYALANGSIAKVLGPGDSLSGKTVQAANSGWQGFTSGNQIVMLVNFTDMSQGIYTTTLGATGPAAPSFNLPVVTLNGLQLTMKLTAGQTYRLQATTNVASSASWSTLTNITSAPATLQYTDGSTNGLPRRFYRLISP